MSALGHGEEIVVPLRATNPSSVVPCTAIRSTLLSASLLALRERGLTDQYFKHLPSELHATVQTLVAGSWIPIEIAKQHYLAVEALGLAPSEQFQIGGEVGTRIQASLLGLVFRLARGSGVTPWNALAIYPKLRERTFLGSDSRVVRAGPKEARVENFGIALAAIPYFRNAWRGMTASALQLFCRRVFVNEVVGPRAPDAFAFRASWV